MGCQSHFFLLAEPPPFSGNTGTTHGTEPISQTPIVEHTHNGPISKSYCSIERVAIRKIMAQGIAFRGERATQLNSGCNDADYTPV